MADEMLRVAGRGDDGTAKAIHTDNRGNVGVQLVGSVVNSNMEQLMDYRGKQNNDVSVPHVSKYIINSSSDTPFLSSFVNEISTVNYERISKKDAPGGVMLTTSNSPGYYALHLFAFNILQELKNKGRIPKTWDYQDLNNAIKNISFEWVGFGEGSNAGVLENGATLKVNQAENNWLDVGSTIEGTSTSVVGVYNNSGNIIQSDGFIYFMAHPNYPSDDVIPSKIFTDYIDIIVNFETDLVLTDFSKAFDENKRKLNTISTMIESNLQSRKSVTNEIVLASGTDIVILDNHEFKDNVTAWALYGHEIGRPHSEIVIDQVLSLIIEYSNVSGDFSDNSSGGKVVFKKIVSFSDVEEFDKALAVISDPTTQYGSNLIVAGKFFNVPMAKYMRITLRSTHPTSNFRLLPFSLVEEGNF